MQGVKKVTVGIWHVASLQLKGDQVHHSYCH